MNRAAEEIFMSEYLAALKFLGDEIDRFGNLDIEELKKLTLDDHLATLAHPAGGSLLCGAEAFRRIRKASQTAIDRDGYRGRIGVDQLFQIVAENIEDRFLRRNSPINLSSADQLFADSIKKAAGGIKSITHYAPCLISDDEGAEEFSIGKIKFRRRKSCLAGLQPQFDNYRKANKEAGEIDDKLLDTTLEYYASFDWLAEVTIDDADAATSYELAVSSVEAALNFLHVLVGTRQSNHFRVGGPAPKLDKRGRFELSNGKIGTIEVTRSWTSRSLGEGWWQHLHDIGVARTLPIIGKVIDLNLARTPTPLSQRLLDAAHWYGDASREKFPASQLVKFVTAMERVLITGKRGDLTKTFCDRGSALFVYPEKEKRVEARKRFSQVYGARSQLVHGSTSPNDKKTLSLLIDAELFSHGIIWRALTLYGQDDKILDSTMNDKKLSKWFDAILCWYDEPRPAGAFQIIRHMLSQTLHGAAGAMISLAKKI
jgi:hypothetical protein